jgi:DNA-binding transcriptional regulator GbsR (MarR family)
MSTQDHIFEGRIRDYEKELIEFYNDVGKVRGQNPKFSTILGYMMIHGSLTQNQLKELTGFSLATVSNILNAMILMKTAIKKRIKGTNAFTYTFDISQIAVRSTSNKIEEFEKQVKFYILMVSKLKQKEYKDKEGQSMLLERLSQMLNFVSTWKELTEKTMKKLREMQKQMRNENE